MAIPRLGITFDGVLYPGTLLRMSSRLEHQRALAVPAVPGAVAGLLNLIHKADIAVFPLWPGRERAHFVARWLKRRLAEHPFVKDSPRPLALDELMDSLEICDRRPDDLDASVDYGAVGPWEGSAALDWTLIQLAIERTWALGRTTVHAEPPPRPALVVA